MTPHDSDAEIIRNNRASVFIQYRRGARFGANATKSKTLSHKEAGVADESKSEVACLFENGDDGRGQAVEAAQMILKQAEFRETCRISSFAWADQNKETPLQAADMLAWRVNLWRGRRRNGTIKKRADFKSLLEVPMVYHHWDRSAVDFLKAMRAPR